MVTRPAVMTTTSPTPDINVDYRNDPLEDSPIIWPAGETTYTLTFETFVDDLDEEDETWSVTIDAEVGFGDWHQLRRGRAQDRQRRDPR